MKQLTMNAVVIPRIYVQKGKEDSILLQAIAGTVPNRMLMSTQFADDQGFELGKKYEVIVSERKAHEVFGRQFSIQNCGEWEGTAISAIREYGSREIIDVSSNPHFTTLSNNAPKTDVVETVDEDAQ